MIGPHATGHLVARDGRLLRIDVVIGPRGRRRWVATRFGPGPIIHDVFYGTEEEVRNVVDRWLAHG